MSKSHVSHLDGTLPWCKVTEVWWLSLSTSPGECRENSSMYHQTLVRNGCFRARLQFLSFLKLPPDRSNRFQWQEHMPVTLTLDLGAEFYEITLLAILLHVRVTRFPWIDTNYNDVYEDCGLHSMLSHPRCYILLFSWFIHSRHWTPQIIDGNYDRIIWVLSTYSEGKIKSNDLLMSVLQGGVQHWKTPLKWIDIV